MHTRSLIFTLWGDLVRPASAELWAGHLIRLVEPFGVSEQAVRVTLSRMCRQGWLRTRREAGRSYYSMSAKGERRLAEAAERIYVMSPPPWDGWWRLFTYTIPEQKRELRDLLRRELEWTGYAPLSSSLWVCPHDRHAQLEQLIASYDIGPYVESFVSRHLGPSSDADLVRKCWDIEAIARAYRDFIEEVAPKMDLPHRRTDEECFVERILLVHRWRKFLFIDPGLPNELLPGDWPARQAAELFNTLYERWSPGTERFYLRVTEAVAGVAP